ncbi:MAG: SPOR domain-containing protein [bacterium]
MNVDRYIGELLYDYECVILPGLGGFISNRKPASVNLITHQFKPPYYQLFFNVHLTENDGLLINYLAQRESVSFAEAKDRVDQYVDTCRKTLEQGETVRIHDIGTLSKGSSGILYFTQDTNVNYNPDAFGLTGFVSPMIKRQTDEEKVKAFIDSQKREHVRTSGNKPVRLISRKGIGKLMARAAIFILLVSSISWGLLNSNEINGYFAEYATVNPFVKKNPVYQPRDMNKSFGKETKEEKNIQPEEIKRAETEFEVLPSGENKIDPATEAEIISEPVLTDEPDKPKEAATTMPALSEDYPEAVTEPPPKSSVNRYYIIAGSFKNHDNAEQLVQSLRTKGYEARIADTNKYGMYRVAYDGAASLKLAKEKLRAIRQEDNAEAWILRN